MPLIHLFDMKLEKSAFTLMNSIFVYHNLQFITIFQFITIYYNLHLLRFDQHCMFMNKPYTGFSIVSHNLSINPRY